MPQDLRNNAGSTLAAGITAVATSLTVASAASFPTVTPFPVQVDSEILWVSAIAGTTFTVSRGQESSTAAAHSSGAAISGPVTALALQNLPRPAHVGSTTPTGGASGDLKVGTGKLWINDAGTWKSLALTPGGSVTNVARSGKGVVVSANNTIIDGQTFQGPGADIFGGAFGVYGVGAYSGVIIRNCIFKDFDHTAIWLEGLIDPLIENCIIQDVTYTGIMLIGVTKPASGSTTGGRILNNTVQRIGKSPGAHQTPDYNAYGIVASMNVGGTASQDVLIQDNLVTDVPLWHGIDTHGGQRIKILHNEVRRCARGIFITSQATAERAIDVIVQKNLVTEPATQTGGTDANTAITTYDTRTTSILDNVVGTAYPNIHFDSGSLSTGLTVSGNSRGETLPAFP